MTKEESQKRKVTITWKAYTQMMKHVLRFGSNAKQKSQFKEVMGILMGRLADKPGILKDVIIEDAIPISHGGHVEVAFKPEDYGSFSVVDSQFAEKGWFSVGWYHSHPGLTCFFSAVDVRNQMGWQGPNPSSIGIVWDHQRLAGDDGDMGFDVYRLDDAQNPMSDYHEIQWIVEPPEDIAFYKEGIVNVINNLQKGEPPILEINEVPDVFGDLEVPGTSAMMAKEPELNFTEISENLKGGIDKMSDLFIQPLIRYLNEWARGLTQGIINKNVVMLTNLKGLKDNLSKSMGGLQSWFRFAISEGLRDVWVDIDDRYDMNVKLRESLNKKVDELSEQLNTALSKSIDDAIGNIIEDISAKLADAMGKIKTVSEGTEEISNTMISQKQTIETAISSYKKKSEQIVVMGKETLQNSVKNLKEGLEPATENIEALQNELNDIKISLKAIISMVKGGN